MPTDGIKILDEWAYQYNQMTEGVIGEHNGHWNVDKAMADFKDIILDCCDSCRSDYETLIPKFKGYVADKDYDKAKVVGMELQSLIVKAVQHKFPNI
ncbi:hypothetical protein MTBPR1_50090 [Candidatus Terasakiella magnetica]|uniref:Uncharacterized protein n=1 Tax=Candidatus Terasakiella magnetica TaxID=1867952 RepID=A0A1C3RJ90_9PROT|nr:hypothetical protein [Candidatus Terasakiella magnetica]SCA57334.1 hypothetical protein MTBPR1_50090 [Candidatus Terasakiella magnetica]